MLKVESGKGDSFVVRKTASNFEYLRGEVVNYLPHWKCAFCSPPGGERQHGFFMSMFLNGNKSEGRGAVEVWKLCCDFVEQFVQDYAENKDDPILSAPGFLGDSVGMNLRVSFRCLFFLQRDAVLDRLSCVPAMYIKGRSDRITEQRQNAHKCVGWTQAENGVWSRRFR